MKSQSRWRRGLAIATVVGAFGAPAASAAPVEDTIFRAAGERRDERPAGPRARRAGRARTTASTGATPESVRAACSRSWRSHPAPSWRSGTGQVPATRSHDHKAPTFRRRSRPSDPAGVRRGGRRSGERPPDRPVRRRARLERQCGQGGSRCLHLAGRRPAPRVAHLRDDARGHPRRPQRDRSPVAAVRVRRPRARGTSPDAAVAAAARDVLVPVLDQIPAPFPPACINAGVASVEADYAAALAAIPDGRPRPGLAVGQRRRRGDPRRCGARTARTRCSWTPGTPRAEPGEYRFTPDRPFAFAPGWADVTPFVLRAASQFRPARPTP